MVTAALAFLFFFMTACVIKADTFGTGMNQFSIDFVPVGNAGNGNDRALDFTNDTPGNPTDDEYSRPLGGVNYNYRIGAYEISQNVITKATNLGMTNVTAGGHTGDKPATNISWYEAAAFVNFLNFSAGYHEAYNLTFTTQWTMTLWDAGDQAVTGVDSGTNPYRHKDAYYFLPSADEWYKAAFHQNDGVTANYWDYATGSNVIPTATAGGTDPGTVVYDQFLLPSGPADIDNAGGLSAYGTMGQNGNVWEWNESALDGVNDSETELRWLRTGQWTQGEVFLRPNNIFADPPENFGDSVGFRVASIPEPSCAWLLITGLGISVIRRHPIRLK